MLENAAPFLVGKGLWLENAAEDLASLRAYMQRGALTYLVVRVADGADPLNWDVVTELHKMGLPIWGAVRLYGRAPAFKLTPSAQYHQREAETASHAAQALNLSGLVLEAREGWEAPGGEERATDFLQTLRADWPTLPLALSSWSYPPAHPHFPGREFRAACAADMPFVFSAAQLRAAHHIFARLTPSLAFAPLLPAFASQQFALSAPELAQLLNVADELGLPTLSVWNWHALQSTALAEVFTDWRAPASAQPSADEVEDDGEAMIVEPPTLLADADEELPEHVPDEGVEAVELDTERPEPLPDPNADSPAHLPEPPETPAAPARWLAQDTETGVVFFSESPVELTSQPLITHFFKALRTGRLAEAITCYAPEFTHLNPYHVTRNPEDVTQFYAELFSRYNAATLAVGQIQGSERLVAVQWTMHAPGGTLLSGQDSFHLNRHNQIVYHDTQFQEQATSG